MQVNAGKIPQSRIPKTGLETPMKTPLTHTNASKHHWKHHWEKKIDADPTRRRAIESVRPARDATTNDKTYRTNH